MVPREIETKFFLPLSAVHEMVDLEQLPVVTISQSYFPESLLGELIPILHRFTDEKIVTSHFSDGTVYGRVRETVSSDGAQWVVTLKGPKDHNLQRDELEPAIGQDVYNFLLRLASEGTIEKKRYLARGTIDATGGSSVECKAEIDLILAAGKESGFRRFDSGEIDFVTVDVEVPNVELLNDLRAGRHTFDFLKHGALELIGDYRALGRTLSMRKLARTGLDSEAVAAKERLKGCYG